MRVLYPFGLSLAFLAFVTVWPASAWARDGVKVTAEREAYGLGFRFPSVPAPAADDAGAAATVQRTDGSLDSHSAALSALVDGRIPDDEDQPAANVFFAPGTEGGRWVLDLHRALAVQAVNSYSWHPGDRAPQVYTLYGAQGGAAGFDPAPQRDTLPESCGWTKIAEVDSRAGFPDHDRGGQHGVSVTDSAAAALGVFRYLLFDIRRTEAHDPFGNTFYSEIDVLEAGAPTPTPATNGLGTPLLTTFDAEDGRYRFTIDLTTAPDLLDWATTELKPVIQTWYPRLVALLPSDGYVAASQLTFRFRTDMGGTPASAAGSRINLNRDWFRRELRREACGSVVHEMVHVVQDYGRVRRAGRTPGWLVEGMADYVRWFLYEPAAQGAEITRQNIGQARYDSSYRITANFLNWATAHYDARLLPALNALAREGAYTDSVWKERTGKSLQALGEEWRKANETRLSPSTP